MLYMAAPAFCYSKEHILIEFKMAHSNLEEQVKAVFIVKWPQPQKAII